MTSSAAPPDVPALRELYSRLELRSLLKQLDGGDGAGAADAPAAGGQPRHVRAGRDRHASTAPRA